MRPAAAYPPGVNAPTPPKAADWAMMLAVAVIGGAAFAGIEVAVETAPPAIVSAGRLWIGAALMLAYAASRGAPIAPLRDTRAWVMAAGVGLIGYAGPLTLFPLAQQTVSSVVAGVYMAFLPLMTLVLAGAFARERLTLRKLLGFVIGLLGVLTMIGTDALRGAAGSAIGAQALLLLAVGGYASANVLMRAAPPVRPSAFAAMFLLCGAMLATPGALLSGASAISVRSWTAIVLLGLFPTGATAIMILMVVRRAGAGFFALSAYLAPLVALGLGIVWLGEAVAPRHIAGLALILCGLAAAGTGFRRLAPSAEAAA